MCHIAAVVLRAWVALLLLVGLVACGGGGDAAGAGGERETTVTPSVPSASAPVWVAIFTHNEDPHHPDTPDFLQDRTGYVAFRSALLQFAALLHEQDIRWNWQSDWNFLNGVIRYEIEQADTSLLAQTAGKNVVRYLHEDLGVEIDPHSHENDGYNYADVAYLVRQTGVEPAPVVGGHIYHPEETQYQAWPRFTNGITGNRYPSMFWRPELLMGAGSGDHRHDPTASGMWRPASETDFFATGGTGIAAFGNWTDDVSGLQSLMDLVSSGTLDREHAWTAGFSFNQSDLIQPGFIDTEVRPVLEQLKALQASGDIEFVQFTEALSRWQNEYDAAQAVHQASDRASAATYVNFSLNTQDFAYGELSAALVNRVLDLHETLSVPLDVFLTTWQLDLFEAEYPSVINRLKTSPVVAMSYHVRAPKPYANNYDWRGLAGLSEAEQTALVLDYETHGLDMVTGLPTVAAGGYAKMQTVFGYAPFLCGTIWDQGVAAGTAAAFAQLGCQMVIQHDRVTPPGEHRYGLMLKPETVDLRLFEQVGSDGATVLAEAAATARALVTAEAPAFVGVKMHDNDFFASQSAWTYVYLDGGKRPAWDPSRKPPLLTSAEQDAMWRLYEQAVRAAAARRSEWQLVNARTLMALAAADEV